MNKETTLAEICGEATDEGTYINEHVAFQVVVRNATARQGRKPSKADLHDPTNPRIKVKGAYFGGSFLDYEGSIIRCIGKSIKAKTYQGEVELSIGDKASVTAVGDAPRGEAPPASQPGATAPKGDSNPPPPARQPEDPVAHFHLEMKKTALLWLHCYQYAADIAVKVKGGLPPEMMQAAISSLFITGKDRGLLAKPPPPRAPDGIGFATFIPIKAAGPTPEEIEAEAKRRAAEAEAAHKAELARKAKENLDEDVPF
jgi:hypothetical protein